MTTPASPTTPPPPAAVEHVWILMGADGHFHGGIFASDERPQWIKHEVERQDRECDVDGKQAHRVVEFAPITADDAEREALRTLLREYVQAADAYAAGQPIPLARLRAGMERLRAWVFTDAPLVSDRAPADFMQLLKAKAADKIAAMSPAQRAEFERTAERIVQILQHDAPAAPLTCCEGDHYKVPCLGCGVEFIVHDDTVVESLTTTTRAWCPACVQAGKHAAPKGA